ncbi:hypothetical protein GQ457_07G022500 [Hibiscus cannabinus]
MAIVSWNVRGLGQSDTIKTLKFLIDKHRPCVIFLSETKQKKKFLERKRIRFKFSSSFYVEPYGLGGGLALWWNEDADISVLSSCKNLIDTHIAIKNEEPWFCSFVYGPPQNDDKTKFWLYMSKLRKNNEVRWCILGDTNMVVSQEEKLGGLPVNSNQANCLLEFMNCSGLMELPLKGGNFTWSNKRENEVNILEKIDRCLFSLEWNSLFPKSMGFMDAAIGSDHCPITLLLQGIKRKRKKEFKFEARWLEEEECKKNVEKEWASTESISNHQSLLHKKLKATGIKLSKWSFKKYGKERQRSQELRKLIAQAQDKPLSKTSSAEVKDLKDELNKILDAQEKFWHQRARVNWLKAGDKNTSFFHATTIQNRRRNSICKLKTRDGRWIEDESEIALCMEDHYKKLFAKDPSLNFSFISECIPMSIFEEMNRGLSKDVSIEEIKEAVFNMGALKAPGPDGYPGIFYQSFWDIIQEDVVNLVFEFFRNGSMPKDINKTNIVLIPKIKNPTKTTHFRPISLCNYSYKVISKILASRLKAFLPEIIPHAQSAFVKGRLIQDNVIVVHEAFHSIKRRRKGTKSIMALKIDLEKAYDKVDWKVLRCGENSESLEHILFFCPFAQAVWKASRISYCPDRIGFPGFSSWWFKLCKLAFKGNFGDGLNLLAYLCWHIWKARNAFTFSGIISDPVETWLCAEASFLEFANSVYKTKENNVKDHVPTPQWTPPPLGSIKINCDASFDVGSSLASAAAILRDNKGHLIGGISKCFRASSAGMAEAIALRLGMTQALKEGFSSIVMESDNAGLISRLQSLSFSSRDSAPIENDIIEMSSNFYSCSFSFVKRCCNRAADWVARATQAHACPVNWVSVVPSELLSLL